MAGPLACDGVPVTAPLHHCLLAALPHQARSLVRVGGEDATRFLQGLLTADVSALAPGTSTAAALLTVKGKIIAELWVLAPDGDALWLALPADIADAVVVKLDEHIIMDDVELEPLPDHAVLLAWHDDARVRRSELGTLPDGLVAFEARHPLPGFLVVGPAPALASFAASLGPAASADAFTAARIRHARPAWGFELAPDHFPPELGFVDAVSYDKGCYLGQEPLSRIHNRGQVNRVMVRVKARAPIDALPASLVAEGKDAGQLTSLASSLDGLAIVRRTHAKPGATLDAGAVVVEVTSGPLGDDPGGPGRQTSATVKLGSR